MTRKEAKHMSEVLKAYSEDKTLQIYNDSKNEWYDSTAKYLIFNLNPYHYRIKPELRPYTNAEEFLQAQKEHGPYLKACGQYHNVTLIDDKCVVTCSVSRNIAIGYDELLKYYNWQDGTSCGILEKNN